MTITIPNVFASWKTTLSGLGMLIVAGIRATHEPTLGATFADPTFQQMLITGIGLIVAKDFNLTGGSNPATPEAADRIAADKPLTSVR